MPITSIMMLFYLDALSTEAVTPSQSYRQAYLSGMNCTTNSSIFDSQSIIACAIKCTEDDDVDVEVEER